jgi:hypothetical protein
MKVTMQQLAERLEQHEAHTNERFANGSNCFAKIVESLDSITAKLDDFDQLREDVAATREVVEALATVKTVGKFVKWTGGISAAVAAIIIMFKSAASALARAL